MTEPTEAEIEAGAAAVRWLEDEAIDPVEVARDVLTAAAQVRERAAFPPVRPFKTDWVAVAAGLTPTEDPPDIPLADVLGMRKDD